MKKRMYDRHAGGQHAQASTLLARKEIFNSM